MSTGHAPRLTTEHLNTLRVSVFRERAQTLDDAAAIYSIPELQANLHRIWSEISSAVEAAPDTAFERQPDDTDGGDVWSVGQIVSHLCDTQVRSQRFWEDLLRTQLPDPPAIVLERYGAQLLTRAESQEALAGLTAAWTNVMSFLPPDVDLERRAAHPAFGQAGPKGSLLVYAVHMDDHLHQILELRA
jgi:hypothetical protein